MVSVVGPGRSAKCALFLEVPDFELEGYTGVTSCAEPSRVSDVSGGNCTFFLGRPLRFLGGTSVSTSAALDSPVSMLVSGDLDRAALLTGVPFRFGFGVAPTSDFLGRPRGRLTGDDASWSFNGTVVVFVLVTRFTDGDSAFTSSLPGSAWTVTLMRQGLAPPARGVLMIIDLVGEENIISDASSLRFCLLGELRAIESLGKGFRPDMGMEPSKEMASGSGLES